MGSHFLRGPTAWCLRAHVARGGSRIGTLAVTVASAALALSACQSPSLVYQVQFRQAQFQVPSRQAAFHAAHVRSAKAVNSDKVSDREADRSIARSVRGPGGGGELGRISSNDEGLVNDPLEEGGKGQPHTFETAVVGSDQWYRERAEDQAKEMALRRKLRICAC
jgi:hypothetical protein